MTLPGAAKAAANAHIHSPLPQSMITRLQRSGTAMLGEQRRATILFADIRGSTEMVDRLDAHGALEILKPLLLNMMDAAHQHDGFVNRTVGDSIMALFGAPLANEDHAVLACQAAVAMRSKVRDVAREIGQQVELRIGLHTGEVLIHSIGHDLAMHFDAMGKAVHIAARLQSAAPPGSIWISADTRAMARHSVEVTPAGRLSLKGIGEPVDCYELVRTLPGTRWQARRAAGLVPMVGRHSEIESLRASLDKAATLQAQHVTVVGAPGLGKSRLIHEFVSELPKDWIVFEVSGQPNFVHSPHAALASILRKILNLAVDEDAASASAKLDAVLTRLGAARTSFEPLAAVVCGVKSAPSWAAADPQEQSARLKASVTDITLCQARLAPLCLVVEDLQWIDAESVSVLSVLRPQLENHAFLMLTSEREPGLVSQSLSATHTLAISGLDRTETDRLVDELMGDHPSVTHVKRSIAGQGEGNPLFIEELVQSLCDAGHIDGAPGAYVARSVLPSLRLPATLQELLTARVDSLEPRLRTVLETAAVIGAEWPYWLLARTVPPETQRLEADIASLCRSGLLFRTAAGLEAKYAFKHDLAREAVYNMMPRNDRRSLHARVVSIIEQEFKDRIDEQTDALAFHAARAELWQKALPYQLRSARRAARRGANRDCIGLIEQALRALDGLPASADVKRAMIDFRLLLVTVLEPLGLHERARENLLAALAIAEDLQDDFRISAVRCQLALAWWRRGEHDKARATADAALATATRLGEGPLIIAARHNLGIIGHQTGRYDDAVAHLEFCNSLMNAQHDERRFGWAAYPSVILRTFLSDCYLEIGRVDDARAMADAAVATARASGHLYSLVQINQVRARIHMADGEIEAARAMMASVWKSVLDNEMFQLLPIMATRYGEALVACGRPAEAVEMMHQPETYPIGEKSNTYGWGQLYCAQAAALCALGKFEEAREYALRSREYAAERSELPQVAYAERMLATIEAAAPDGDPVRARHHREACASIAASCGMATLADAIAGEGRS